MSRIDDDRDVRRRAEQKAIDKRLDNKRADKASADRAAFSAALDRRAASPDPADRGRAPRLVPPPSARASTQQDLHTAATDPDLALPLPEEQTLPDGGARDVLRRAAREAGRKAPEHPAVETPKRPGGDEARVDRQRKDAVAHAEKNEAKADERLSGAPGRRAPGAPVERAGDDGRQRGGGGGGRDEKPESQFKLPPPALMAPPPLALPKESPAGSRIRALAQEIVNRIVERARVGTNQAGLPEFQIELHSNVLAGLLIKVSSNRGRIRASFVGRDPSVLKQIRLAAGELKEALAARGIPLEELSFDVRL